MDDTRGRITTRAASTREQNASPARGSIQHTVRPRNTEDRRGTQRTQNESERTLRQLADAIPHLIWTSDREGGLEFFNERWYAYTGLTFEQSRGSGWSRILHPDDAERVKARWRESLESGRACETEYRLRSARGEYRWFKGRAVAIRDESGAIRRWFGTCTDVNDQRRAKERIRESGERLDAALTASKTAIFRWNIRTGALESDGGLKRMFGVEIRHIDHFVARVHPESRQMVADAARRCAESGDNFDLEFRVVLPDASVRWLAARGRMARAADGSPDHVTGACVDVSDRRNGEEAMRQAQKLESLGVLAGGIAHDFNNLLVGIMGNASVAQESLPEDHPDRERLQGVVRASERAADLTRQLLAYAGKGEFVLEPVDLSELVRDINALIRTSVPRRVRLLLDLPSNLPLIEADRGQIQQVTMNLLINAAEAIPENRQGMVRASTFSRRYDRAALAGFHGPAYESPGVYVGLEVHDTGAGIDEQTAARIFDPFFTTKSTGRGLGLSAVQGIVRASRGGLRVVSKPGLGTQFTVLFPALSAGAAVEQADSGVSAQGSGQTVLVVDDEELVRDTVVKALERYGYRAIPAANGPAAIQAFTEHADEIAAVLLDLTMPLMSAEEVLARIRTMRPDVPVLLSSGYGEAEAARSLGKHDLAMFIQKPYTAARVAAKIAAALSGAARKGDRS